ncbi:MAG TPA: hypothetical protein VNP03_09245, partial [Pseudonocardia sp.]|nr:hypothetical protein [Pseudonocardia sp.]
GRTARPPPLRCSRRPARRPVPRSPLGSGWRQLDRRFALVTGAWSVPEGAAAAPSVVEPAQRRRRARVDLLAGLCVLPLLLMAVPTLGPWLDQRTWALLLAAALVCVALPLLLVQALVHGRPALVAMRARALGLAAALVVLLVAARLVIRLPVPPLAVLVLAALLVAGLTPVALRLLPSSRQVRAVAVGAPVALALVAAPVGDLLDGVYLDRLDLRPTDVAVSFAQRWWSGAFFGVTALAGLVLAAVAWGWWRQLDAVGRRRTPAAALLALLGTVYAAALLALAVGVAWNQAGAASDRLPGRWGGIAPAWVCWAPAGGGPVAGATAGAAVVPFAGRGLPPTEYAVVWLGGADGQYALWSPDLGGVRISDQVQLRRRDAPGRCP